MIYVDKKDIPDTFLRKTLIEQIVRKGNIKTYSDPDCKKLQCDGIGEDKNKKVVYRSVTDLLEIVNSRFEKTTLKALLKIIQNLIKEDQKYCLVYCNMINKVVLKYVNNNGGGWISNYSKNNYFTKKGVDGYSLEDYENILKNN